MKQPVEYTGRAFQNMTLPPDRWGHATGRSSSCREKNPRTTSIICELAAPTPPVTLVGLTVENKAAWSTAKSMALLRWLGPSGPRSGPDRTATTKQPPRRWRPSRATHFSTPTARVHQVAMPPSIPSLRPTASRDAQPWSPLHPSTGWASPLPLESAPTAT
jgi:hypothetical protein